MKWKRIPKEKTQQPIKGKYSDWKPILAEEGFHQCVYCAISEAQFGGSRNFHVEHYKPKARPEYKHLINDIRNLFYACAICNTFKGADWPSDPDAEFSKPAYPDPSSICYEELFLREDCGVINGKYTAAKYMIEKLYLNRPQLILERRLAKVFSRIEELNAFFCCVMPLLKKKDIKKQVEYMERFSYLLLNVNNLLIKLREIPPYADKGIRR